MSHDFKFDPLHAAVPQGGFSREKGGNLRDHDGCKQHPATAATTHYDGDYGIVGVGDGGLPYTPGPMGGGGLPSTGGGSNIGSSGNMIGDIAGALGRARDAAISPRESKGIGKGPRR